MPLSDYPKIQKIIDEDYKFRFGDYFSDAAKILEEYWLELIGFFVFYFFASYSINLVPDFGSLVTTLFGPVLLSGVYIFIRKGVVDRKNSFDDFFEGFKFINQILPRVLATNVIILMAAVPFGYFVYESGLVDWVIEVVQNPNDSENLAESFPGFPPLYSLFLLIPVFYFAISYMWADLFIVMKKMNFWDAMEASRQVITNNWMTIFLFYLVIFIGIILSVFVTCGFGILISIPFLFIINYVAFADVIGLNDAEEEDGDIFDHLIDEV